MKLFGGFHGDRSKTGNRPSHPAETEADVPRSAQAPKTPEVSPRWEAPVPEKKEVTQEVNPIPEREAALSEEKIPAETDKALSAADVRPEQTESEPEAQPEPEKLSEPEAAQTEPEAPPARDELSDTKVFASESEVSSDTKVLPELGKGAAAADTPKGETESGESTKQIVFRTPEEEAEIEQIIAAYQKKKRRRRIIALAVVAVLVITGVVLWKHNVKPPEIVQPTAKPTDPPVAFPTATPANTARPQETEPPKVEETPEPERMRRDNVYTFLLVGRDQGYANTDTIMVGIFDVDAGRVDIVSIPRDTCANVDSDPSKGETKKISGVFSRGDIEGLKDAVSDMTGFPIDCYVTVGVNGFIQLVNTIGGVNFNVPYYMDYDDPTQDLHIHFSPGVRYLNGYDAIKVVRWRQNNDGTNYGDIARINTQQEFLKTVFKQCLSLNNLLTSLDDYVAIFQEYVKTDLTTGNMTWFAKELFKLDMDDIHFHTMPSNYNDSIGGFSYGTITVDEWLEMLNEDLNPYDQPIELEDVSIISRDENGNLYATSGEIRGGMDSFLTMEQYLRQLQEYNDWLERQKKKNEESAGGGESEGAGSGTGSGESAGDSTDSGESAGGSAESGEDTGGGAGGDTPDSPAEGGETNGGE